MYTNQTSHTEKANQKLTAERLAYTSTTAPLHQINGTLREIKEVLVQILEVLNTSK